MITSTQPLKRKRTKNLRRTFFDVTVACARKLKLASVKLVTRYEEKELLIEEWRNSERKYGSAVIMTVCFNEPHATRHDL